MELIIVGANQIGESIVKNYSQFGLHHRILGFVDDRLELQGKKVAGFPVLGQVEEILFARKVAVIFAYSSLTENAALIKKLSLYPHLEFPNLISSGSWISRECIFGKGNLVLQGSLINFGTKIGSFNFFGENCFVGHESVIGDLCRLENEVTVGGYVVLEDGVEMHKGTEVLQGVRIGKYAILEEQTKINEDVLPLSRVNKPVI
jgi:UDP-3-O-[3-hydroxymyristoyl] glucosamine N-acyltransferase